MRSLEVKKQRRGAEALGMLTVALLLLAAATGCTGRAGGTTSASSPDSAADVPSQPVAAAPIAAAAGEVRVQTSGAVAAPPTERAPLPRLVDLGAKTCIPCKKMAPILEELAETKADYFEVLFIDVREELDKAGEYAVRVIPTQIFYGAAGKELHRHIGFYSREQILEKWRSLGIDVGE